MAVNPKPLTENDIRTIQVWIGTDSHLKKTLLKADVLSALRGLSEELRESHIPEDYQRVFTVLVHKYFDIVEKKNE